MREAGDVCYADVFKDGTGVVEFLRYEDMKYAVKKLDDSRFRSHEVGGAAASAGACSLARLPATPELCCGALCLLVDCAKASSYLLGTSVMHFCSLQPMPWSVHRLRYSMIGINVSPLQMVQGNYHNANVK